MTWWQLCNLINAPHRFFPSPVSSHRHLFTFPNNQSICASGQCDARVSCPRISVMGFIGRLGKTPIRRKQAKEVRQVFKRGVDFTPNRSNILPKKRRKKRPPETKEEVAYWLSKSGARASEKQFFVQPVRPNRPFRTLPPRLVPAGALLYIVPAFLGDRLYSVARIYTIGHCDSFGCFVCRSERLSRSWRWSRLSYRKLGIDRKLFPTGRWDSFSIGINTNFQMSFRMYQEIKEYQ